MAKLATATFRVALLALLAACSEDPRRSDTIVEHDPSEEDDGDGDGSDADEDEDKGEEESGSDQDDSSDGDADGDGDDNPNQCVIPQAVYYGTLEPTAVLLSPGQILAIGELDVGGVCSGTLVKRDWVLTAKHCTRGRSASRIRFYIGEDPANANRQYVAAEKFEHPSTDTALLRLASSPVDDDPGVVPIRINDEPLEGRIGEIFEGAGYGSTERGSTGTRFFTAEPLVALRQGLASVDGEGRHGLCGGDSGGPLLGRFDDGPRVVGGLFHGDSTCVDVDNYARTDVVADWIVDILGPLTDCGDVDEAGTCDGQTARYCDGGAVRSDACSEQGLVCGLDEQGRSRCIEDRSCGELTGEGSCEGNFAHWCENDERQDQDCAASGLICARDESGNNRCVPDPCAGIAPDGECRGDVATLCLGRSKVEVDCASCAQTCVVGASGPSCVDAP